MNKLLFVLPSYGIGGTTVSTLNLINLLSKRGWKCSVLPLQDEGDLFDLYSSINKVSAPFLLRCISVSSYKSFSAPALMLFSALVRFLSNHSELCLRFFLKIIYRSISGKDYTAIVATQESLPSKIVARLPHRLKIAWVRCDYLNYLKRFKIKKEYFYSDFNYIVSVSSQGAKSFIEVFPELKNKVYCIPNPQDSQFIIERSNAEEYDGRFNHDCFTIVSVGRMDPVKRYTEIPRISRILIDKGLFFRWYLIGDGVERQKIIEEIEKWNVADIVILLGVKQNPHYYIKNSDLYVCLSSSESCPRVINEAKILGTPTISTDFPSIYEFVEDGKTGWIGSLESMPALIAEIINNDETYNVVAHNLISFNFDNTQLIESIEKIFTN